MEKPRPSGRREWPVPFVADRAFGLIDSYDSDANRVSAAPLELNNLVPKVIYYAVDLLYHRLRENLHFNSDFDRRYRASGN